MQDDILLTMREAMAYLQISRSTMYRLMRTGQLTGHKVRSVWRFYQEDVRGCIKKQGSKKNTPNDTVSDTKNMCVKKRERKGEKQMEPYVPTITVFNKEEIQTLNAPIYITFEVARDILKTPDLVEITDIVIFWKIESVEHARSISTREELIDYFTLGCQPHCVDMIIGAKPKETNEKKERNRKDKNNEQNSTQ